MVLCFCVDAGCEQATPARPASGMMRLLVDAHGPTRYHNRQNLHTDDTFFMVHRAANSLGGEYLLAELCLLELAQLYCRPSLIAVPNSLTKALKHRTLSHDAGVARCPPCIRANCSIHGYYE